MYVIKRDDGKYVAGFSHTEETRHSYTDKLQHARTFQYKRSANENACDNETVCEVSQELTIPCDGWAL